MKGFGGGVWDQIAAIFGRCGKPIIYTGESVIASDTGAAVRRPAENLECLITLSLERRGGMRNLLYIGPPGMHSAYANGVAISEADHVLALRVGFDERVSANPSAFVGSATIVHIDVDATEIGKNKPAHLGIEANLRDALAVLHSIARSMPTGVWSQYLCAVNHRRPLAAIAGSEHGLSGPQAIAPLATRLPEGVIVATGIGQYQMRAMLRLALRARRFLTSGGFDTRGFPAAIEGKCASPDAIVIDIVGDVNCIGSEVVITEQLANEVAERHTQVEEVAELVVFLASSAWDWITGQIVKIDGAVHLGLGLHMLGA
jgi:acetolactate synthase-1/2/3 large subunit